MLSWLGLKFIVLRSFQIWFLNRCKISDFASFHYFHYVPLLRANLLSDYSAFDKTEAEVYVLILTMDME